ncbi:hypothetical protein JCM10908_001495 [Rhodotorula pacifica]|uniref:uncharacterized protein n=1 Tax=Rhodotorula pacifica TaxID=1495444 RepID=UPI003172D7F5
MSQPPPPPSQDHLPLDPFPGFVMCNLDFQLDDLEKLYDYQLALVPFHPQATPEHKIEAEVIFWRRRVARKSDDVAFEAQELEGKVELDAAKRQLRRARDWLEGKVPASRPMKDAQVQVDLLPPSSPSPAALLASSSGAASTLVAAASPPTAAPAAQPQPRPQPPPTRAQSAAALAPPPPATPAFTPLMRFGGPPSPVTAPLSVSSIPLVASTSAPPPPPPPPSQQQTAPPPAPPVRSDPPGPFFTFDDPDDSTTAAKPSSRVPCPPALAAQMHILWVHGLTPKVTRDLFLAFLKRHNPTQPFPRPLAITRFSPTTYLVGFRRQADVHLAQRLLKDVKLPKMKCQLSAVRGTTGARTAFAWDDLSNEVREAWRTKGTLPFADTVGADEPLFVQMAEHAVRVTVSREYHEEVNRILQGRKKAKRNADAKLIPNAAGAGSSADVSKSGSSGSGSGGATGSDPSGAAPLASSSSAVASTSSASTAAASTTPATSAQAAAVAASSSASASANPTSAVLENSKKIEAYMLARGVNPERARLVAWGGTTANAEPPEVASDGQNTATSGKEADANAQQRSLPGGPSSGARSAEVQPAASSAVQPTAPPSAQQLQRASWPPPPAPAIPTAPVALRARPAATASNAPSSRPNPAPPPPKSVPAAPAAATAVAYQSAYDDGHDPSCPCCPRRPLDLHRWTPESLFVMLMNEKSRYGEEAFQVLANRYRAYVQAFGCAALRIRADRMPWFRKRRIAAPAAGQAGAVAAPIPPLTSSASRGAAAGMVRPAPGQVSPDSRKRPRVA